MNLIATFDSNIVPKLYFDHKKKLVVVKIEKSPRTSMEIFGTKEGDFNFKSQETSKEKDTKLPLIHFPPQKVLPMEPKNIEYIDGNDSTHSSNDEERNGGLLAKKTMTGNDQLGVVDPHIKKLKFFSKVKYLLEVVSKNQLSQISLH